MASKLIWTSDDQSDSESDSESDSDYRQASVFARVAQTELHLAIVVRRRFG